MTVKRLAAATAGVLVTAAAIGAPSRPTIPLFDAATIAARCDTELAKARATKKAIEAKKAVESGDVFADWNRLSIQVQGFGYPVYLLQHVATDKATRDAAQTCLEKLLPFETEMAQSEPLYRRVRAVKPKDAIEQTFKQDLIEKFDVSKFPDPPSIDRWPGYVPKDPIDPRK